jgi:protein gp37
MTQSPIGWSINTWNPQLDCNAASSGCSHSSLTAEEKTEEAFGSSESDAVEALFGGTNDE